MCEHQMIRYPNGTIEHLSKNDIEQLYNNRDFYIKKQIRKELLILSCGKCKHCLQMKQSRNAKLVDIEFKRNRYNYLLTITFNDEHIDILDIKANYWNYSKVAKSQISNLSKIKIANIIKNIKNKLNRYYQEKIKLNYILCGEYGSNTKRAHYHIFIMINKPIPYLVKENVAGNHYKSKLIQSKQFGLYDIEPITNNQAGMVSKYITKYITKQEYQKETIKYNLFMEKQLKYYLENNIKHFYLFKNEQQMLLFFLWTLINDYDLVRNIELIKPQYMQEFIKKSRSLGIYENEPLTNLKNGTLNSYYKNKIKNSYLIWKWDSNPTIFKLQSILYIWTQILLFEFEQSRINNIKEHSLRYDTIKRNKSIFKERRDIF